MTLGSVTPPPGRRRRSRSPRHRRCARARPDLALAQILQYRGDIAPSHIAPTARARQFASNTSPRRIVITNFDASVRSSAAPGFMTTRAGAPEWPPRSPYGGPAYTSQRCSACGYTARNNRRSRDAFACRHCGFALGADVNAARNIRARAIVDWPTVGIVDAGPRNPGLITYKLPALAGSS